VAAPGAATPLVSGPASSDLATEELAALINIQARAAGAIPSHRHRHSPFTTTSRKKRHALAFYMNTAPDAMRLLRGLCASDGYLKF
jgi:hypothetical protein